jgi:hypothetical protein
MPRSTNGSSSKLASGGEPGRGEGGGAKVARVGGGVLVCLFPT